MTAGCTEALVNHAIQKKPIEKFVKNQVCKHQNMSFKWLKVMVGF
jgi:hypothetical protein